MKVYGLELSEKMNPCEYCGFPCFDDELVCPQCNRQRESLLGDDAHARAQKLRDFYARSAVLERASRRGRGVFVLLVLLFILFMTVSFFFFAVEDHWLSSIYSDRASAVWIFIFSVLPYLVLVGFPFLYFTRMRNQPIVKNSLNNDYGIFRLPRGFLRYLKDGHFYPRLPGAYLPRRTHSNDVPDGAVLGGTVRTTQSRGGS